MLITEGFEGLKLDSSHAEPDTLKRFLQSARQPEVKIVNVGTNSTSGPITDISCNPMPHYHWASTLVPVSSGYGLYLPPVSMLN